MNKVTKTIIGFALVTLLFVFSCQKKVENKDTMTEGKATLYVDESILPIVEDQSAVFDVEYNSSLKLVPKSENEIINSLLKDTAKIAILTRKLSDKEIKVFESKKIVPKITAFATDAVAFIKNNASNDSLVALQDVIDFVKGKATPNIKGLVFDNANSSTARYISELAGIDVVKQKGIYSLNTNQDVIKYVAENNGMIGIIGMNWIYQPPLDLQQTIDKITILSVKDVKGSEYVFPSQENVVSGKYPLARDLYIVNCQGYSGLGMGFTSFLTSERGQRIILKSGLAPKKMPSRKVVIRNTITKDKN